MSEIVEEIQARVANARTGLSWIGLDVEEAAQLVSDARRWREHSIWLNTIACKIAAALGEVPEGADRIEGNPLAQVEQLIRDRDQARSDVDQWASRLIAEFNGVLEPEDSQVHVTAYLWRNPITGKRQLLDPADVLVMRYDTGPVHQRASQVPAEVRQSMTESTAAAAKVLADALNEHRPANDRTAADLARTERERDEAQAEIEQLRPAIEAAKACRKTWLSDNSATDDTPAHSHE